MNNKFDGYSAETLSKRTSYKALEDTILTNKDYTTANMQYDLNKSEHISDSISTLTRDRVLSTFSETRLSELKSNDETLVITFFLDENAIVQEIEYSVLNKSTETILQGSDFSRISDEMKEVELEIPPAYAGSEFFKIVLPLRFGRM